MNFYSLGEWLTTALAFTSSATFSQERAHEISTGLNRVSSALRSDSLRALAEPYVSGPGSASNAAPINALPFPPTRAQVFAERLVNVRPICLMVSRAENENCLLDLPPGANVSVSAVRLILADCEASIPAPIRAELAELGRDGATLERAFSAAFARESQNSFSAPALRQRLATQLHQMTPYMQRLLRQTDAYIEVPQLTFQRLITSVQEARRHGITVPFTTPDLRLPAGSPEVRNAMLGAYLRIPSNDGTHTFFVSLMSPQTITLVRQDPKTHATGHVRELFGDIPAYWETSHMQMRALAPPKNVVHDLAQHLHDGFLRYREFAYGATRETLAPISHANVIHASCEPVAPEPTMVPGREPSDVRQAPVVQAHLSAPNAPVAQAPHSRPLSKEEVEKALKELELVVNRLTNLARPRFG